VLDQMLAGERWGSGYRAMFDTDVPALLSSVVVSTRVIETPNDLIARLDDDLPAGAARFETIARQDDERSAVAAALAATGPRPLAPARPRALDGAITRTYARTPFGQLLARCAGALSAAPLLMLHPSPGSGARLEPLITALASTRRVVALDTLGNGDSDKPVALATPTIADYAVVFEAAADALGLETFDLYGSHTGAIMALEVALRMGGRVRSLILDGITLFSEQENAKFLDGYFVDLTPAWDGTHLIRAWSTVRDGRLWFPWHDRRPEAIAPFDLLDASGAQAYTLEMLKSGATYSLAYQAVFTHPTAERLALLETRTLVCHPPGDPLARFSEPAAALAPNATACALPSAQPDRVAEVLVAFLDESRPASI
jgi:pimeloyl-ACP methyl ester carboxylesterase